MELDTMKSLLQKYGRFMQVQFYSDEYEVEDEIDAIDESEEID